MDPGSVWGVASALCLGAVVLEAQETNQVELFNQHLKQLQASFEKQQREMRENFERLVREQQAQIDALRQQLDAHKTNALTAPPAAAAIASTNQAATPPEPPAAPSAATAPKPWSPTDPIRLAGGQRNYLNLSLDALVAAGTSTADDIENLEAGAHDPNQRGFTVQNLETVLEGAVDPYFRGQANVILQIDPQGETTVEAEEAYLETMALPWNLQVKAGLFITEFGRLNPSHPHTWDFVDVSLANARLLGPEGLRNPGARISWLTPTPFYSELFLAVQNSQGETAFSFRNDHDGAPFMGRPAQERGVETFTDLLLVPRYAASFDLSEAQTILAGASAAFGPNSTGSDTATQIYGLDLFWKWKSPRQHSGFPFVAWQTEAMARHFEAGAFPGDATTPPLPRETLVDYGLYSQVAYGFRKGWVVALRGDYVFPQREGEYEEILGPDPDRAARWRLSPNLTYYPSEFSKVRLQYNLDHRDGIGDDHSVWVQFEFLLGSHAAHKF